MKPIVFKQVRIRNSVGATCLVLIIIMSLIMLISCNDVPGTGADDKNQSDSDSTEEITEGDNTSPDGTQDGESSTGSDEETQPELHPGDAATYEGVLIYSVYGTGKSGSDAVIPHGYVQLCNISDKDISLSGASLYYKTDGTDPYTELIFPDEATVPAHGYYLVRAKSPANYVSSNAVLTVESFDVEWDIFIDNKEIRLLFAPSGWIIDRNEDITKFDDAISVFVAGESYNSSVYAVNDLSRNKIAVRTALKDYSGYHLVNLTRASTPDLLDLCTRTSTGKVNAVVSSRISEVTFSHDAGIYDKGFDLTMKAPEGYTIFYTMDGSDPTLTSNPGRIEYNMSGKGISLKDTSKMPWGSLTNAWRRPSVSTQVGAHVIKAYATNGKDSTAVFTNTYFITDSLEEYGVNVMSISIPKSEILGRGFYENYLSGGSITAPRPRGVGILEVFDVNGNRVGNSRVEMAVSGNGSSGFGMKSLRIYYKGSNNQDAGLFSDLNYDLFSGRAKDAEGEAITSFSRLLLRNSGNDCGNSYMRDAYMQRVCSGLNVDTMASATVLVFINGEFWGVYNARERYSPEYVESHYGVDKDNVTIIESDYSQVHTDHNAPFIVSSGEPGDADPFNEMVSFMRTNNLADEKNYEYVCSLMDIDSFIDMWITRLYFNARDWPENNIKVWRNKNPNDPSGMDTKWHFTLLDMDMGLAFFPKNDVNDTSEISNIFWAFGSNSVTGAIMRSLLQNEGFKNQFIVRFYELLKEHFTEEYLSAELEAMISEREPLMSLQAGRWSSDGASVNVWRGDCKDMRNFVSGRAPYIMRTFLGYFGIEESDIENLSGKRISISFHTQRVDVTLDGEEVVNGNVAVKFEEGQTVTINVVAKAKEGFTVTGITYTDKKGNSQEVKGSEATFTVSESGNISIFTIREGQDPDELGKGTLVAGATYLFYLTENGDLYAWGDNRYGVLGLPASTSIVSTPTYVMSGVSKVVTSSANAYENGDTTFSTAILTVDGRVLTVGKNTCGQLGRNGMTDSTALGEITFNGKVTDISMGHDHLLIVDDKGTLWGVGSNAYGALGSRSVGENVTAFVRIADDVEFASAGRRSTVYVTTDKRMWGLGDNRWKKLSRNHGDRISTPVVMTSNIEFVDSGEHQILAVNSRGQLYYAGWRTVDGFAQGAGNNPTLAHLMDNVKKADIYFGNVVILTNDGDAYVYGLDTDGGIGGAVTNGSPKKLISGVADVAAGYGFTAYLMEDGRILIQGSNSHGQAGNGKSGGTVSLIRVNF